MEIQHDLDIQTYKAQVKEKTAQVDDMTTELIRLREKLEMKAMQEEHKHRENTLVITVLFWRKRSAECLNSVKLSVHCSVLTSGIRMHTVHLKEIHALPECK